MGTAPPPDDPYSEIDPEDLEEELGLEVRELDDEAFRTVDGAQSDEPLDPAMIPVIEAGGGVSEGFEQSEAALVDNASYGPLDGTQRILDDAFDPEDEEDRAVYGEADEEDVSEDE
ncbi:MAG: hypothetical protein AB7V62_03070 [Thermoleophilia bacterium]